MTRKLAVGIVCLLAMTACGKKNDKTDQGRHVEARQVGQSSSGTVAARPAPARRSRPGPAKPQTTDPRPRPADGATDSRPAGGSQARQAPAGKDAQTQQVWKEQAKAQGGKGRIYHLALNMKKGFLYHAKMVSNQTITQTIFGKQQVVEQVIGFGYDLKLLGRDKQGVMHVLNQYTWVRFKQKLMGRSVDYDSSRGGPVPQNPMARVYAALNGASFTFYVTPDGHITKVDGMAALMKRVVDALPDGPNKPRLAEQIKKKFSDKMFRESLENIMAVYPEGGVRVGGTWSRLKRISLGMALETFTKYRLVRVAKGLAHLAIEGKVRTPPGASMDTFNPKVAMHYDIHGTQTGDNDIAIADGMVRSWTLTQKMSGRVTISRPGGSSQDSRSWPIAIASVVSGTVTVGRAR